MGFNYAAEKKKFETLWARLRREYRAAGMSDAAIQKMHDFDWEVFKQERIYRLHARYLAALHSEIPVIPTSDSPTKI